MKEMHIDRLLVSGKVVPAVHAMLVRDTSEWHVEANLLTQDWRELTFSGSVRVEATLADGSVVTGTGVVDRTQSSHLFIDGEGDLKTTPSNPSHPE